MRDRPIGIFDSGVGGLSVLLEVQKLLPHEDLLYYADSAHCPYGEKPPEVIQELAIAATQFLMDRGAKLVVVACNTASSAALQALRARFACPIVGMVPAVKPASTLTRNGRVGVIATQATVEAQVFADLVAQFAQGVSVFTQACPGLVSMIEAGILDSTEIQRLLHLYLDPLLAQGIDTLVLGCTHYPFLRPAILRVVGRKVNIIDTGAAVARQVERVLSTQGLLSKRSSQGSTAYYASGDEAAFDRARDRLLAAASPQEVAS